MRDEHQKLLQLVGEKCDEATEPVNIREVIRKFTNDTGSETNKEALRAVIRRYSARVHEIPDERRRARHLFALSVTIKNDLLEKLRVHAKVKLDDEGKIIEYVRKDGTLNLKGDQSHGNKVANAKKNIRLATAVVKEEERSSDSDGDHDVNSLPVKRSRYSQPGTSTGRPIPATYVSPPLPNQRVHISRPSYSSSSNIIRQARRSGVSPNESGVAAQMHPRSLTEKLSKANQEIFQLKQRIQIMKNGCDESKKIENRHQNEIKQLRKNNEESARLHEEQDNQHSEKYAKLLEENANLRKLIEQTEASHQVVMNKSKEKVAQDLEEVETRHQNVLEQMRRETGESVRQQKDQEKQHKEKVAKLLVENANLRKLTEQAVASHRAEINKMKEEEAQVLKRIEDRHQNETKELRKNIEDSAHLLKENARKMSEMEMLHKKEIEQLVKNTEESARVQKEKDEMHEEQQATLQRKIDDLLVDQKTVACLIGMFNKDGDTTSTSRTVDETITKVKIAIIEEAKSD